MITGVKENDDGTLTFTVTGPVKAQTITSSRSRISEVTLEKQQAHGLWEAYGAYLEAHQGPY